MVSNTISGRVQKYQNLLQILVLHLNNEYGLVSHYEYMFIAWVGHWCLFRLLCNYFFHSYHLNTVVAVPDALRPRYDVDTISTLQAFFERNPSPVDFLHKELAVRKFYILYFLCCNSNRRCWWVETPWTSCDITVMMNTALCHFLSDPRQLFVINSSPPSTAYMRQRIGSVWVQSMACSLFGATPLSKPMKAYGQLDANEHTSVKF